MVYRESVLPLYIALDTSASMWPATEQLSSALSTVVDRLLRQPVTNNRIYLSVVSFSDEARLELRLTPLSEVHEFPELQPSGSTYYSPVLRLLRETISRDVQELKEASIRVFRPVVAILTDGTPIDSEWQSELQLLADIHSSPTILAFGFGTADPAVLSRLASRRGSAFFARSDATPETAVADFAHFIETTTVTMGTTVQSGATTIQVTSPGGFIALPPQATETTE